ncbi:hypothetical protein DPMN_005694 [Dreissena polymorpha]|uniref:Uncharacterized protein n=1 Tax=Dreissena polymorpha TaxID=45954 RepID=A0A9D4MQ52_DREPO|nr:hypothetical protein DPMN_005694 [Dreissena polymorpha]
MTERTGTSVRMNRNQCQNEQEPASERTRTNVRKNRHKNVLYYDRKNRNQCQKEQEPVSERTGSRTSCIMPKKKRKPVLLSYVCIS